MVVPSCSGSCFVSFLWPWGSSLPLLPLAVGFSPDTTGESNPWLLQQGGSIGFPLVVPVAHLHANCCTAVDSFGVWISPVLGPPPNFWAFFPSLIPEKHRWTTVACWEGRGLSGFLVSSLVSPGSNTYLLCICWSVKPVTRSPKQG